MSICRNQYRIRKIRLIGTLFVLINLFACAGNIRNQAAATIAGEVKHVTSSEPHDLVWFSPVLQVSRWRTRFCCYDRVYYRLSASDARESAARVYRLLINADYGGEIRHYDVVRFPGAATRFTKERRHEVERCQFFNSLIYACLFRDHVYVDLSRSELESGQSKGLQLKLGSRTRDYETIDLPANFIRGFLDAVK
ncbi:MAG: hypothetical protein L0Y39_01230 [Methylococcaceae bacterium]|nr:hypothetical protein [Methylococcaceae bacterium]